MKKTINTIRQHVTKSKEIMNKYQSYKKKNVCFDQSTNRPIRGQEICYTGRDTDVRTYKIDLFGTLNFPPV